MTVDQSRWPARRRKGRPGLTHCGRWTVNDVEQWGPTRFVCVQSAGHDGPHRAGVSDWTWTDDDRSPRKDAAGGEADG